MARTKTNGLTDHAPLMNKGGDVHVTKRLVELTKRYNPTFDSSKLEEIIKEGTLDYFYHATNKQPYDGLSRQDARLMNQLYAQIRDARMSANLSKKLTEKIEKKEDGGQLDSVSDMLPSPEPMDVIQPMDITQTITPMETGGKITIDEAMVEKNLEIQQILTEKGFDKEKYSAEDLKTITHYSYETRLMSGLVNKMWGLAQKHGFGGFKDKKINVFNAGNGELLRFIPDTVNSVEVYENDADLNTIVSVLFSSDKVKVHRRLRTMKNHWDLAIGVCGGLVTLSNKDLIDYVKSGGLLIAVVPTSLMDSESRASERANLNSKFTLLEAFRLPSDIMDGYDLIALKKN